MSRVVIVGGGGTGDAAAFALRKRGFDGEIVILSADRDRPYDRPYLSKEFLRSEVELPKVFLHEEADYVRERIDLRLASPVIGGSLRERTVTVSAGEVAFDVLVLGLGGTPRRPQGVPSADNVLTLRSLRDSQALSQALGSSKRLEQVAHAAGADADEHLHEVRSGDGEERNARLSGDGPGEQRLSGSRGAHEEDALGDAPAELGELLRVLEEGDDLLELFLRLVDAGDVGKGDLVVVLGKQLRLALAEAHRLAPSRLQLAHEKDEEDAEDAERHPGDEELGPERLRVFLLELQGHALLAHLLEELAVERRDGPEFLAILQLALQHVPLHGGRGDVASLDRRIELARVDLLRFRGALLGEDRIEGEEEQDQDCPEKEGLVRLSHLGSSSGLGSIVAERDSCRRLDGNGPSGGFISGQRRKETPPLPHAGPGRNPSTQKIRPCASARSASRPRCSLGMPASIQRSATFFVRPAAGRKRSPGRRPRSVHGNGAFETSTATPSLPLASTSSTREAHE